MESVPQGSHRGRWSRAVELFEVGAFERVSPDVYIVANPKGGEYTVFLKNSRCGCEDYRRHHQEQDFECKHLIAVRLYRDWLRKGARALAPMFDEVA